MIAARWAAFAVAMATMVSIGFLARSVATMVLAIIFALALLLFASTYSVRFAQWLERRAARRAYLAAVKRDDTLRWDRALTREVAVPNSSGGRLLSQSPLTAADHERMRARWAAVSPFFDQDEPPREPQKWDAIDWALGSQQSTR